MPPNDIKTTSIIMVAIATTFVGTATAVLALTSGRNMVQTYTLARKKSDGECSALSMGAEMSCANLQGDILAKLQSMPRRDLLNFFLSSQPPAKLDAMQGDWNGILLPNNLVLTSVTYFITNFLFGRGRKWNGKAFYKENKGYNRFHSKADSSVTQT